MSSMVSAKDLLFGQPVYETHPHKLKPGEVTPGISAQEYHSRRQKFAASLPNGAVAVLPAATLKFKSGPVFYPYRQESNFWYLTGWEEPESLTVIEKRDGDYHFTLFCRPKDERQEQWMGPWSGLQAAKDIFNADAASPISHVEAELRSILKNASYLYTDVDLSTNSTDPLARPLTDARLPVRSIGPAVNPLRVIKSPAEIEAMRHVGKITGRGFNKIMASGIKSESQTVPLMNLYFSAEGCSGHAYAPIVASGRRGLFIHWVQNTGTATDGELMTIDAGAEYGGYVADVTRTWPVNGKFSTAQKDLYNAVLLAQRKTVSMCRETSSISLNGLHRYAEAELRANLRDLGFNMSRGDAITSLLPHHVGHYVGIDVHDVPGYSKSVPLRHGHCITVEPGVYVPDDERWPEHFRNMGIRIEDFLCVDEDSAIVFSSSAVKEVDDIENLDWSVGKEAGEV
ncbi:hypothetical protein MKZ38_001481 [Zalerion maritima]|uniref:Xaa-Pro aminopeptidase n=1 Tax=Zalerion maritima TaxID=339359 RepID=A0AAD5RXM6_9PEZI|nr:hypothetical protein MKZ38_001481 [Zalerion maritima]